jgi:protein TonB
MKNDMTSEPQKHKGDAHWLSRRLVWIGAAVALIILITLLSQIIKFMMSVNTAPPKAKVQQITLVKPPPPVVKEKPPEIKPEPEKVEEKVEIEKPQEIEQPQDNEPPPAGDLGVDADASGSGDGFGLQARKGGASLVGGMNGSGGSIYGWYTSRYANEIQKHFNEIVSKMGGIKGSGLKTIIRLDVDNDGGIRGSIIGSSGDPKMDEAVIEALKRVTLKEPPPAGMPRAMKLGIMSQG